MCVGWLCAWCAIANAQGAGAEQASVVQCQSTGPRVECVADTSRGVVLRAKTSDAACTLGQSWGYDVGTIWVKDGCAGEFGLGGTTAPSPTVPPSKEPIEMWGTFEPGKGFLLGRTARGEVSLSVYGLVRYLNQTPAGQTYVDHLGRTRETDLRHDIWAHRIMFHFKGWLGVPRLRYQVTMWTVNTTDQNALFAVIGYQFHRKFSLYGGLNGLPGTRTLQGSHPYWLGHDRVLADEFFRPYFAHGVWATGEPFHGVLVPGHGRQQPELARHYRRANNA